MSKRVEVVQRLAPDVAKLHEATIKENFFSLTLLEDDIIETPAPLPRYHLNALTKLIEKGIFTGGGPEEKALKFKRELLDRLSKAKEENEMKAKARKAKVKRDSCQKHCAACLKKARNQP